jgi:hypothetical protein
MRIVSRLLGTVPGRNSSLTVFLVYGPGRRPVNASTVAVFNPLGALNEVIGVFLVTASVMADQSGADESSDKLPLFGALFELPIHTPTTIAGSSLSLGGATNP